MKRRRADHAMILVRTDQVNKFLQHCSEHLPAGLAPCSVAESLRPKPMASDEAMAQATEASAKEMQAAMDNEHNFNGGNQQVYLA